MKRFLILSSLLFLTACSSADGKPVIGFIGVATGTLATQLQQLQFKDQFDVSQKDIIAVVAFKQVKKGTTVQATWFSPDDRRMPLGRTSIVTESGATITRFSFASTKPWQPAPYMLQINAMTQEGDKQLIGTGSLQFYIGMKPADIEAYQADYAAWKKADAAERAAWDQEHQKEQALLDGIKNTLGLPSISIVEKQDVFGDPRAEYIVSDAKDSVPPQGGGQGVLLSAAVHQAAIADGSGAILLSIRQVRGGRHVESDGKTLIDDLPREGDIQMTIVPSLTLTLSWLDGKKQCFADITPAENGYALAKKGCR